MLTDPVLLLLSYQTPSFSHRIDWCCHSAPLAETARLTAPPTPPWQRVNASSSRASRCRLCSWACMRLGKGFVRLAHEVLFQVCVPIHTSYMSTYSSTSEYEAPRWLPMQGSFIRYHALLNTPEIHMVSDMVTELCLNLCLGRDSFGVMTGSPKSRRDSLPAASRLDHRCLPPLPFHHAGWRSLGVRPRPRSLGTWKRSFFVKCLSG